jgi:glucose/arabinose dehydrogenase
VETVVGGLDVPWALAFAPDGRLFLTERRGRVRVVAGGRLQPEPVATLPAHADGESGLMGLALDPGFADNGHLRTATRRCARCGRGSVNRDAAALSCS